MKYSCSDNSWVIERNHQDDRTLEYADMASLERSISLAYSTASQRLFELFFDKFKLMDHLRALKDYLMLGKGDFCEILMEQLGSVPRPLPSRTLCVLVHTRTYSLDDIGPRSVDQQTPSTDTT
jgi:gamma-tubulin complex component 3